MAPAAASPAIDITAGAVWLLDSGWPDILVAMALLLMFLRSAIRVLGNAWRELRVMPAA